MKIPSAQLGSMKAPQSKTGSIVCYFVYANGGFEGETKTFAGALRMARKITRLRDLKGRPMRALIKVAIIDGDRSWNETIGEYV